MSIVDIDFSENLSEEINPILPINNQLSNALLHDAHYITQLLKLSTELKNQDDCQFDDSCESVIELVQNICSLETRFLILREFFRSQDECLPIQLLWAFECKDLLHFPVYLAKKPEFIAELSERLIHVLFLDCKMNLNVVITLIKPTFVSVCLLDPALGCPSEEFHSTFQIMCVEKIFNPENIHGTNLIEKLTKQPFILSKPLLLFVRQTLRRVLVYTHSSEVLPSITDAINKQNYYWTYKKIPQHITDFIRQLLNCLFVEDVIKICNDCLSDSNKRLNWKWFLVVISTLIVSNKASGEILKKNFDLWLKESVIRKSKYQLSATIIVFRQCFAESVPPFTSYASWFSSLNVHFDNSRELLFFLDYLSEIVPHEPTLYLKIHINKVPSVPPGAHAALSDYISLVKTRLADLNETTDYIGLFGEYKSSEKEGRESDIARVVSHYRETNDILKTVIEASVFRRTYYECVFLPDLLQTELDNNSPRYKLIERLHMIGKCPNSLYMDWIRRNDIARQRQEEKKMDFQEHCF